MTDLVEFKKRSAADVQREKSERTQARVGLASNAVGLAAGVAGTATATRDYRAARHLKRTGEVLPVKEAKSAIGRGLSRIKTKHAVGAAAAGLGLQVANVGGDVVANRVLNRAAKDPVKKSDTYADVYVSERERNGQGTSMVAKAQRRFDPEADRQRRQGLAAGAGVGGSVVLGQAARSRLKDHVVAEGKRKVIKVPTKVEVMRAGKTRTGLLLAGLSAASGAGGVAAYRRGVNQRNRPWN